MDDQKGSSNGTNNHEVPSAWRLLLKLQRTRITVAQNCLLNVTGPTELHGHCFKYSVLAAFFTGEQVIGQLPWSDVHQYRDRLNFDSVPSSGKCIPVTSIPEFEDSNDFSINIYGYEENEVIPVDVTKQFK